MSSKFTVSETDVRKRDGESYSIESYQEGVDYVQRKCFKSMKRVFRSDILGASIVDPSLVEHKQEPKSTLEYREPVEQRATLELDEMGMRLVFPQSEPTPEDWRPSTPECKEIEQPQTGGHKVKTVKVRRIHVNNRWVETDIGRIWAGAKGNNLKVGQIIRVLNGELFLGKTEPSGSLVRV